MRAEAFKRAIARVGGVACLPEGGDFCASIQADFTAGEPQLQSGADFPHSYLLFAEYNEYSGQLCDGDRLFFNNEVFYAALIETVYFGKEPLYRRGKLHRELQGGY